MNIDSWSTGKIYDYILDIYIGRNYLEEVVPITRNRFTGKNLFVKVWNVLERPLKFIKQGLKYEFIYKKWNQSANIDGKVWLFYISKNNYDSLSFLLEHIEDAVLVGHGIPTKNSKTPQLPFYRFLFYSYKFPGVGRYLSKKYGPKIWNYFDLIFKAVGQYEAALKILGKHRPKCIVLANDHSELPRAIRLAAAKHNIPCVYIQHASIAHYHPHLDFDLSLLEGEDAKDKYLAKGNCEGTIKLIGMPKFDEYLKGRNFSKQVKRLGICTNLWETTEEVESIIKDIKAAFPALIISFRPHPADVRKFQLDESVIRSTKAETAFNFLSKQDLIIAGNTSMHLEAVLLNVVSVHFEISPIKQDFHDYYGYIKNGLVPEAKNKEELMKIIEKECQLKESVFQNARYYNALVGTDKEGRSGEVAAGYIGEMLVERERRKTEDRRRKFSL